MTTTKERNQKIEQYILDCIDPSGYNVRAVNDRQKLNFIYSTFKKEYGHHVKRYGNETKAFAEWLKGLPSSIGIDFENYAIEALLIKWGILSEKDSNYKKTSYISQWFERIAIRFFVMFNRKEKTVKVKTIDIEALEWFDRVNGNSYFAGTIEINKGLKSEKRFIMPFQYGYGDHYVSKYHNLNGELTSLKTKQGQRKF